MKDWRGIEIEPGQDVIYGVSHGSNGTVLVHAKVANFHNGRVRLEVVQRSRYGVKNPRPVLVDPDKLVVVTLPELSHR